MNIFGAFGIHKAESSLPYGMSSEQYAALQSHFGAMWQHQDDPWFNLGDRHSSDNAHEAFKDFTRRVGPWYARGLFGRVSTIPDEHTDIMNLPDQFYFYSAPNEWHTEKEFKAGRVGENHDKFKDTPEGHYGPSRGRGHGVGQSDTHIYGSASEMTPYPRDYFSGSKFDPAPPIYADNTFDPRTALPFRPVGHLARNLGELASYRQSGPDPANWPDNILETHMPNRTPDEVMEDVERWPGEHQAPPPPDTFDTDWWDSQMNKMLWKAFGIHKAKYEPRQKQEPGDAAYSEQHRTWWTPPPEPQDLTIDSETGLPRQRLTPSEKSGIGGVGLTPLADIDTSEEEARAAFSDRIKALDVEQLSRRRTYKDTPFYQAEAKREKAFAEEQERENIEAEKRKQASAKEQKRIARGSRVGTSIPPEVVERRLIAAQKKEKTKARAEARRLKQEEAEQEEQKARAFRHQIDKKRWAEEHQKEVDRAAKWEEYKRLGPAAYKKKLEEDKKKLEDENKLDKMLRKAFGIRKDMPPEPLGEAFPQHELKTVECELGQCLSNSTRSARRNLNMNPHIIHGSHIDLEGPHSWVEFDHPEHGKIVFDPTSGLAGTPKDMYQDPAIEGRWGRNPNTPLPRLDAGWPTLIPEYRYALRDYHMKTGEREDNMGFIDHPDHKISEEDRLFPSRSFFENKNPGKERAMWDTLHQFGRKALPEGDHTGYAPIEKMLWKMFGIQKEDGLPFDMNSEQYETMRSHFKDALVHKDNTFFTYDDDGNILDSLPNSEGFYDVTETPEHAAHNFNVREAWKHFMEAVGPWYARGLYGKVHRLPHEDSSRLPPSRPPYQSAQDLQYEPNPERYIRQSDYSAPNQWHSREDFERSVPGQEHPRAGGQWPITHNYGHHLDDGVSNKHNRVHDNHWFGSHRYWGPYNKHWFEHGEDNTGVYNGHKTTVNNAEEGYHPDIYAKHGGEHAQALPFLDQDVLDRHHIEDNQRHVYGPDPEQWEDGAYYAWTGFGTTGFHHPLDYKTKYWKDTTDLPEGSATWNTPDRSFYRRLGLKGADDANVQPNQQPPDDTGFDPDEWENRMNKMLWKMFGIEKADEPQLGADPEKKMWNPHGEPFPTFNSAPDSQGNERAFEANNFGRYQSPRISRAIHRNDRGLDTDHLLLERTRATDPDNLRFGNRPAQYPHEWKLKALSEHYNNLLIANRGRLPLDVHQSIHGQAAKASDPDMNIAWHSTSENTHPLEPMDYTTFAKDHLRRATYLQDEGLLYPYGPNYKLPANPNPVGSQSGNRYLMENVAALRYPVEDIIRTPEWKSDFKNIIDNYKLSDTLFSEGQPPAPPDLIHYKPPTKYGNIPSGGPPIKATWGEPQDVHEMQREHRRKRGETLE